jgi:DNA-binding NtrC family response regulator
MQNDHTHGPKTILLVDDEVLIRDFFEQVLQTAGYQVITAGNGREGLALYQKNRGRIDLVLSDIDMPCMTGLELFRAMKQENREVRCLLFSGGAMAQEACLLKTDGLVGFLCKPVSISVLISEIKNALDSVA